MDALSTITSEDLVLVRRQLSEGQALVRDTVDRLGQSQEENEMIMRRRDELESRVAALEAEYEELLGECTGSRKISYNTFLRHAEKTIHDEETNDLDLAESMTDLKVSTKYSNAGRPR
jgi:kinesin family member 5